MTLTARINTYRAWLDGCRAFHRLSQTVTSSGLDTTVLNLVLIRASQINGCAYCCDMHTREAKEAGETDRRLHTIAAWRDTTWFDERERAALALTEAVTQLATDGVPANVVDEALRCFGEEDFAKLLWAIVVINGWNRINVTAQIAPPP